MIENDDINILIVDDHEDILYSLKMALEQKGVAVFTTAAPKDVLQICVDKKINIILLDIQMPEINGLELLDLIKSNPLTHNIMVILITGHSMNSASVVTGLKKGAVDFLFKPLDLYITIAKINSFINLVQVHREIDNKNRILEETQRELLRSAEEAKKSKAVKENFLANMSHEIRTPLTAIIGLSHLLKTAIASAETDEMIKLLEHATKSLLSLVNDILDSEKIDAGKIAITRNSLNIKDLVKTVCDLTRPMALEKGIQLNCLIDDNVPSSIMADGLRLNQILMNLVNNAIKFTPSGKVDVKLLVIETRANEILLSLSVADTGIGIPGSALGKIYERFEQSEDDTWQKFGGTGLGLSIVKRLAELKGGYLLLDSTVNEGTTFTFNNWYALAAEETISRRPPASLPSFTDEDAVHILLAEDNPINQFITTKILKQWNIRVTVAVNGQQAIDELAKNDYNLILMDTHMPVMNGYEATRRIRQDTNDVKKNIPIITFSASVMEDERATARAAGVDDFILKPFDPVVLYQKIYPFIKRKGPHI